MKILALEHDLPTARAEDFQRYATAEAARAWTLHQEGVIRELYFRADRPEACWCWNAPTWPQPNTR